MKHINVIFDGPPGPEAGRFGEVEDENGRSFNAGEWIEQPDGLWALRLHLEKLQTKQMTPKGSED